MHALQEFNMQHPEITKTWHSVSNYLCFLTTDNENTLSNLYDKTVNLGIACSSFYEPDIGNKLTAIAIAPSKQSKKICNNLKLALK